MAWRIDEQVVRGEIDNRTRDRVTGKIWLIGRDEPVVLDLKGNPWRDLAGHVLRFSNPNPKAAGPEGLMQEQNGVVGDITASRKVKVPECSDEEFEQLYRAKKPFPWHWSNSLYLEWFSLRNGRVMIESSDFILELEPSAAWTMSPAEETEQRIANGKALTNFMQRVVDAAGLEDDDFDDDAPQSKAEAEADKENARMDLLMDRVTARLDREGHEDGNFERILKEERERLRRERGEPPEPEPTPEEIAERNSWIEEMNAATAEVTADLEAEKWKGEDPLSRERHPLVESCSDLSIKLHHDVDDGGWLPEDPQHEHPLIEIVSGTMSAGAKLAGALGMGPGEEWPPDDLIAGNVLVRLKKARNYLRDAISGLDSADEEQLATPEWRADTRREIGEILGQVQQLIREVRDVLE